MWPVLFKCVLYQYFILTNFMGILMLFVTVGTEPYETLQSVRPTDPLSVRLSARLSHGPFSLSSHHRIIMKFSGVITNDRSDVYAKV